MQSLRLPTPGQLGSASNQLPIGGTIQNLVAGSKFEFLPMNAAVRIYAVADQVDITVDFTLGNVIVGDDLLVPLAPDGVAGVLGPNTNEHRIAVGAGAAGDRIQLRVTGGAAATTVRFLIEILPV